MTHVDRALETGVAKANGAHGQFRHWRFHQGADEVVWLLLDKADSDTNTLDAEVFEELKQALDAIEASEPRALVIRSFKDAGFAAGADIRMLVRMTDDESVTRERLAAAHALLDRIEQLRFPTIAVLHGHCLGGGLELALACKLRIGRSDTTLGLPEVKIGLHPGLGGTARLTEQIAPTEALTLMLTGKSIDAKRARTLGLIDAVVDERHVANAVQMAAAGQLQPRSAGLANEAKIGLMSLAPSRALIANRAQAETEKRTRRDNMPAPFALIDLWREHGDSRAKMLTAERESFVRLLGTPAARNLIRVFFLREKLKALGKDHQSDIRHVHVIGAGAMGGDIAAWCALHGLTVTIEDTSADSLGGAYRRAAKLFEDEADGVERNKAFDRFTPDFKSAGLRHADLVIEAVPEDADIKRQLYQRVEPQMKNSALLATNTSSLRLEQLRADMKRPQRFIGLHFFNPVRKLELVEVVEHDAADRASLERAYSFVTGIDRLPAPVRSAPGFLVNRALMPYMLESLVLLDEGVAAETIDAAAMQFGMPMGPVELADRVGLDICLAVADVLKRELEDPMPEIPDWFRQKVERGEFGMKSGRGLYEWSGGKPKKKPDQANGEQFIDRLMLPQLNACVACLRENVVADEDIVDAAMIFATGFAPFRGGPMHYARERGVAAIVDEMKALQRQHGARFAADVGWQQLS